MGFPHPTVDLPGEHSGLIALAATTVADPFGVAAEFAAACRGHGRDVGHLCVTNWVVSDRGGVLLVRHPRLGWATCGGHVERGEDPAVAAARELWEETGLDATVARPIPRPLFVHRTAHPTHGDAHVHWNVAFAWTVDGTPALRSEPGRGARWFDTDHLPADRPADVDTGLAVVHIAAAHRHHVVHH